MVLQWKIRPLLDNSPSDTYHYIVTVVTSSKMSASTASNISFILAGDDGDSDVRFLNNGYNKVLIGYAFLFLIMPKSQNFSEDVEFLHLLGEIITKGTILF